jgi:hypothetical protein
MDMGRKVDIGGVQRYYPIARVCTPLCSRQDIKGLRICCEEYYSISPSDAVLDLPEIHEDINWNLLCRFGFCATPQMFEG